MSGSPREVKTVYVLFVSGGDYSFLDAERAFGFEEAARLATSVPSWKYGIDNTDQEYEVRSFRLTADSIEFVEKVADLVGDYDGMKGSNFHVLSDTFKPTVPLNKHDKKHYVVKNDQFYTRLEAWEAAEREAERKEAAAREIAMREKAERMSHTK